jgi:hypothetical protein
MKLGYSALRTCAAMVIALVGNQAQASIAFLQPLVGVPGD